MCTRKEEVKTFCFTEMIPTVPQCLWHLMRLRRVVNSQYLGKTYLQQSSKDKLPISEAKTLSF